VGETLLEVDLAAHGGGGDRGDLLADAGQLGEFVDDFGLDQGRVHVKDEEAALGLEFFHRLQIDVDTEFRFQREQIASLYAWIARQNKLAASFYNARFGSGRGKESTHAFTIRGGVTGTEDRDEKLFCHARELC